MNIAQGQINQDVGSVGLCQLKLISNIRTLHAQIVVQDSKKSSKRQNHIQSQDTSATGNYASLWRRRDARCIWYRG